MLLVNVGTVVKLKAVFDIKNSFKMHDCTIFITYYAGRSTQFLFLFILISHKYDIIKLTSFYILTRNQFNSTSFASGVKYVTCYKSQDISGTYNPISKLLPH